MFGTNDLHEVAVDDTSPAGSVVRKCLDHGTVVILSTIPPRHGFEDRAAAYAVAARHVSRELAVPLVDYHGEILRRRPNDWDGASEEFRAYRGHDVPTLIGRDGVHPSLPQRCQNSYSPRRCGPTATAFGVTSY